MDWSSKEVRNTFRSERRTKFTQILPSENVFLRANTFRSKNGYYLYFKIRKISVNLSSCNRLCYSRLQLDRQADRLIDNPSFERYSFTFQFVSLLVIIVFAEDNQWIPTWKPSVSLWEPIGFLRWNRCFPLSGLPRQLKFRILNAYLHCSHLLPLSKETAVGDNE